ncbi:60S acidic ribosomal protein P1 [Diplonema papillatum]|nr:60S acidic ribosomal protein P1 [Diplonema papillatum]
MSTDELACTYAALILHDEGLEISADKITSLTKRRRRSTSKASTRCSSRRSRQDVG